MSPDTEERRPSDRFIGELVGLSGEGRILALVGIAVALLLAGSAILIWRPLVGGPVESFEVVALDPARTGRYLKSDEVVGFAGLERGAEYSAEELAAAATRLALHPAVREARIEQRSGGVVEIQISERRCAALVRNQAAEQDAEAGAGRTTLYEIDEELVILAENRVRCTGVPLVSGTFTRNAESQERFTDPVLARLIGGLEMMRERYPELAARISELHLRRTGDLTLFLTPARVRVELTGALLDEAAMKRLYAAVAFFEKGGQRSGVIDLRGQGVVILPE